jgi:exodeoxyribonuclease V gamma subunit
MKNIANGLIILQGNRLELLRDTVFEWLEREPLAPLEEEVFLTSSPTVGQWLSMELAQKKGISAAIRHESPAQFLWRMARDTMPQEARPSTQMNKAHLTWHLWAQTPECIARPEFLALHELWLRSNERKRFELCQKWAGLFEQYAIYRPQWLETWAHLDIPTNKTLQGLPTTHAWQSSLWQELWRRFDPLSQMSAGTVWHQQLLRSLAEYGVQNKIPRRVVVFGLLDIPPQERRLLHALSEHCQLLWLVLNPCRHDWIHGVQQATRAVLSTQQRQASLQHRTHPLLVAWGRQSADALAQLDAFDEGQARKQQQPLHKIDVFDDASINRTLLEQVQNHICEGRPLAEHLHPNIAHSDQSIVFHVTHSPHRELEVLHVQLLALFSKNTVQTKIQPKNVLVMVPDMQAWSPIISGVFGQYADDDLRRIPFEIEGQSSSKKHPQLLRCLQTLLIIFEQRCGLSQVRELFELPAVAAKFQLQACAVPALLRCIEQSGVRWGLNSQHRTQMGFKECGDQNTWHFGLQRMLLGYASGAPFAEIEPYVDLAGLDSAWVGSLAAFLERLTCWWETTQHARKPAAWVHAAKGLLDDFFLPAQEAEQKIVNRLGTSLHDWLSVCNAAQLTSTLSFEIFTKTWLEQIERTFNTPLFLQGGVTFCSFASLRHVPFEMVCLLGINEGHFPRNAPTHAFDLMANSSEFQPGDKARHLDDRQSILDALLCARQIFYMSWVGYCTRDNSPLGSSVSVKQLQTYLAQGWSSELPARLTCEHPTQDWSRFISPSSEPALKVFTPVLKNSATPCPQASAQRLAVFFKNPVRYFLKYQLGVSLNEWVAPPPDEELFDTHGLEKYQWLRRVLTHPEVLMRMSTGEQVVNVVEQHVARLHRSGEFPMAGLGQRQAQALTQELTPMLRVWQLWQQSKVHESTATWYELVAHNLCDHSKQLRAEMLLSAWIRSLECAVSTAHTREPGLRKITSARQVFEDSTGIQRENPTTLGPLCISPEGVLVGRDVSIIISPMAPEPALAMWDTLQTIFCNGQQKPLPIAPLTALAWLSTDDSSAQKVYEGSEHSRAENAEASLKRCYPSYQALTADGQFATLAQQIFEPLLAWLKEAVRIERHEVALASQNPTS